MYRVFELLEGGDGVLQGVFESKSDALNLAVTFTRHQVEFNMSWGSEIIVMFFFK